MKTIKLLGNLITIYYYIMLAGLIFSVYGVTRFFLTDKNIKPKVLGESVDFSVLSTSKIIGLIVIVVILYTFYVSAIYLLKNSVKYLSQGDYFSKEVIANFKKIGRLFVVCAVLDFVGKIIISLLIDTKVNLSFDSSLFLFLIMGLFFMFLSKVFSKGKQLQEENDLTI